MFSCYDTKGLLKQKNTRLADGGVLTDVERNILQKFYNEKCKRRNSDGEEIDEDENDEDDEDEDNEDDADEDGYTEADYARFAEMQSYIYSDDYIEHPENYH